jgi:hypothetical protein
MAMTDIGKTPPQEQQTVQAIREKGRQGPATTEKPDSKAATTQNTEVRLAMKAKMVELLLAVKTETTTTFAQQAAATPQAADSGLDLEKMTYNGTPLVDLDPAEAQELVAEDGYFGVAKTAQRIADFVLNGGGDTLERLQAGREGVIQGFQGAEEAWGGALPEISHQTLARALELIDAKISELGGALIDVIA